MAGFATRFLSFACGAWFCLGLTGCTLTKSVSYDLTLDHDTWVYREGETPQLVEKGTPIEDVEQPIFLEAPGRVSMLVLPDIDQTATLAVSLKPIDDWGGEVLDAKLGSIMNGIMNEVIGIQTHMNSGEMELALRKVEALEKQHPRLSYLKFFKASCLTVMGQYKSAKTALEIALRDFPEDPRGLALKDVLSVKSNQQVGH